MGMVMAPRESSRTLVQRAGVLVVGALVTGISTVCMASTPARTPRLARAVEPSDAVRPRPPRRHVVLPSGEAAGPQVMVRRGQSLQRAIERASPGTIIVLEAGVTYAGPFTLPVKPGKGWITIRSSAMERLPKAGTRVNPTHAEAMPKLTAAVGPVVRAARGAHHYRFEGIEIHPNRATALHTLVALGNSSWSWPELPHHIYFDRCYLHGDARMGTRRGIALEGAHLAVHGSHLENFKTKGSDSQAIAGWSGPGPFAIVNNTIEAAGENVMFGGADAPDPSRIPSDIVIQGNTLRKPLTWRDGPEKGRWTVKNLFELKAARRVRVTQNVLEHNWVDGQNGFAILFTVRNQDGGAPWTVVEDVLFDRNVVRRAPSGVNILGRDDARGNDGQTRRIAITNNFFAEIGGPWGGQGTLFQVLNGTRDIIIENNTAMQTGSIIMADGLPHEGFVFRYNDVPHNELGITGSGTAPGAQTLQVYFPNAIVTENLIQGAAPARYPQGNLTSRAKVKAGAHAVTRIGAPLEELEPLIKTGS